MTRPRRRVLAFVALGAPAVVGALIAVPACRTPVVAAAPSPLVDEPAWVALFDGRTLGAWKPSPFGGNGSIALEEGRLVLGQGSPMTGVTFTGAFPRDDYELELDATRVLGNDFFCGLTFPVGDAHLTLVLGGWGGSLCGFSCLDGQDAASNETKSFHRFDRARDFHVRLRVAGGRVQAWLDGEPLADVSTAGRALSLRPEVEPSRPLGLATYATAGAIRNVRWRRAPP